MKYETVPDIITGKDLSYLKDMFMWNYVAFKSTYNCIENIKDKEVRNILDDASSLFYDNMKCLLNYMEGVKTDD